MVERAADLPPDSGSPQPRVSTLTLTGLECADCAVSLERALSALPGVIDVDLAFSTARLKVAYTPGATDEEAIGATIGKLGYGIAPAPSPDGGEETATRQVRSRWLQLRSSKTILTLTSGLAYGAGLLVHAVGGSLGPLAPLAPSAALALFAIAIASGGYYMARAAVTALKTSRGFEINLLMTLAVIGALWLGHREEAAEVVFLFNAGNLLSGATMDRTRSALRALLALAPSHATVRQGEREFKRPLADVQPGTIVVVRPGERIPVDGEVMEGASTVDQSALTGESMPLTRQGGDAVLAGTINGNGTLTILATQRAEDSAMARIVKLVEDAQARRTPIELLVDRFSAVYTPAVLALAVSLALIPALLGRPDARAWAYQALALLIVSCPCALVAATPVAVAAAIARASRKGLLIKGGAFLEALGRARVVVFDKTGTLTRGHPTVTDVVTADGIEPLELLALAAALERRSEHPFGEAIVREHHRLLHDLESTCSSSGSGHDEHEHEIHGEHEDGHEHAGPCHHERPRPVEDFLALPGRGVCGTVGGRAFCIGNPQLMADRGIFAAWAAERVETWQHEGKTTVLVGEVEPGTPSARGPLAGGTGRLLGAVALADEPRPEARRAIAALREAGIAHIAILTGDRQGVADPLARSLGADGSFAELLPDDKVLAVRNLIARHGNAVVMVGDGINDAPALATATVGVAMGERGTAAAVETADVALMRDDLGLLAPAVELGRQTVAIIGQNIALALLVKAALVILAFAHALTLSVAVLGDVGTTLLVVLNGMRLLDAPALRGLRSATQTGPDPRSACHPAVR